MRREGARIVAPPVKSKPKIGGQSGGETGNIRESNEVDEVDTSYTPPFANFTLFANGLRPECEVDTLPTGFAPAQWAKFTGKWLKLRAFMRDACPFTAL